MSEQNIQAYAVLARAYKDAGFANYVLGMTPRIVTFMQQDDWMGRRILDIGCGTGASSVFLADKGFNVIALDYSKEMMDIARIRVEGTGHLIDFMHGDLRTTDFPRAMDLVFAMGNVVNELMSMAELELFFRKSYEALEPGRRLVFDMLTLRGLGDYLGNSEEIMDISDRIFMTVQNRFSFDTMSLRQHFIVYYRNGVENTWERHTAAITLRSYPHAAVTRLLEKVGFTVRGSYNSQLTEFNPIDDTDGHVLVVALKPE